MKNQETCR